MKGFRDRTGHAQIVGGMRNFRDLEVWRKAHRTTLVVYKVSDAFPRTEMYGLTSQMRRAASSVGANIAEGCGSDSQMEFGRYLFNAMKSATELEYHLLLARDLGMLPEESFSRVQRMVAETRRMLAALIRTVRPRPFIPDTSYLIPETGS
jgi:four helix bundle protein